MKTKLTMIALAIALLFSVTSSALAGPGHAHKATPKGGRLLDKTEPHAEFVVEADHSVSIHFYDDDLKPIPVSTQVVSVIAAAKSDKATLEFEKKGDSLVSKTKLPEGDGYNVVVQFKQTATAKPLNLRFKLEMHKCGECQRAEYACICGH